MANAEPKPLKPASEDLPSPAKEQQEIHFSHPKTEKHTSDAKIKEMSGNYDLFHGADEISGAPGSPFPIHNNTADNRKSGKLQSDAKRREIAGNYDFLTPTQ